MTLATLSRNVNYNCNTTVQATILTTVNYKRNTFIVQATAYFCAESLTTEKSFLPRRVVRGFRCRELRCDRQPSSTTSSTSGSCRCLRLRFIYFSLKRFHSGKRLRLPKIGLDDVKCMTTKLTRPNGINAASKHKRQKAK
jgi:hypothetical protein